MTRLDGTFNFRDTAGMALTGGGSSAADVLFRSDALSGLTDEGLAELSASPIGVVVDFRTPIERQMAPDRLPSDRPFRVVQLPLLQGATTGLAQQGTGDAAPSPDALNAALAQIPALGDMYVSMLQEGAAAFAGLARLVGAVSPDQPSAVLVHCTAGKDRTGVSVALMLDAAGVERDAIVADYASSQDNLSGAWAERMFGMIRQYGVPLTDDLRVLIAGTPASAIEQALAWVDAQGGTAAYLQSGGLERDELTALRARIAG